MQAKKTLALGAAGRVGKGRHCVGQPARRHLHCPVGVTKFHPFRQPQRRDIGLGQPQPQQVDFIGNHRTIFCQRQRITADATAQVKHNAGRSQLVDPGGAMVGDRLRVRPGERVPVDGVVLEAPAPSTSR